MMTIDQYADTLTVDDAEAILSVYGCREHCATECDRIEWDAAWKVAYGAYRERNNLHINGVPA